MAYPPQSPECPLCEEEPALHLCVFECGESCGYPVHGMLACADCDGGRSHSVSNLPPKVAESPLSVLSRGFVRRTGRTVPHRTGASQSPRLNKPRAGIVCYIFAGQLVWRAP